MAAFAAAASIAGPLTTLTFQTAPSVPISASSTTDPVSPCTRACGGYIGSTLWIRLASTTPWDTGAPNEGMVADPDARRARSGGVFEAEISTEGGASVSVVAPAVWAGALAAASFAGAFFVLEVRGGT